MKYPLSAAFVGLAVVANWLASRYIVDVPFTDLVAPAGVFCIGAALVLRDWIQQLAGLWWTLALGMIYLTHPPSARQASAKQPDASTARPERGVSASRSAAALVSLGDAS